MTTKADIDAAQKAIDVANNAINKLDLCGLYDCACKPTTDINVLSITTRNSWRTTDYEQ